MKFAIIETGGKQYKISEGESIKIEKLKGEAGGEVCFDKVLLIADEKLVKIGTPYLEGEKICGEIAKQGRDKKKIIFRYHSKTRYRKLKGHRQHFTEVKITK